MSNAREEAAPASIWGLKPWWCQPWSIVATGLVLVVVSWLTLQRWWVSGPLAAGVLMWWWLFLVAVPRAYREQLQPDDPAPARRS